MLSPEEQRRFSRMEFLLEDTHSRLFGGDGLPGHVEKTDVRLKELEKSWALSRGFFWAVSAILSFFGLGGVMHILKGGK